MSLPAVPITLVAEGGYVHERTMTQRHISVPLMFSAKDVRELILRFEICSKANKWSKETMSLKLPMLSEFEALATWVELSEDVQVNYDATKQHLLTRLNPVGFVSLDRFQ